MVRTVIRAWLLLGSASAEPTTGSSVADRCRNMSQCLQGPCQRGLCTGRKAVVVDSFEKCRVAEAARQREATCRIGF